MLLKSLSRLSKATQAWFSGTVLSPYVDGYVVYLKDRGYARATINSYPRAVAHFAHWSAPRLSALEDGDEKRVRCFVDNHLPRCQCAPRCIRTRTEVRAALMRLVAWLRSEGLIADRARDIPTAIAAELDAFDRYLAEVRGLQEATRQQGQLKHVRLFLLAHFAHGAIQVETLAPGDIERFVRHCTAGCKPASVKQVCIALRSYLRFKTTQGVDTVRLAAALRSGD